MQGCAQHGPSLPSNLGRFHGDGEVHLQEAPCIGETSMVASQTCDISRQQVVQRFLGGGHRHQVTRVWEAGCKEAGTCTVLEDMPPRRLDQASETRCRPWQDHCMPVRSVSGLLLPAECMPSPFHRSAMPRCCRHPSGADADQCGCCSNQHTEPKCHPPIHCCWSAFSSAPSLAQLQITSAT